MLKLMKLASERASESTATVRDRNTFWLDFQIYLICLFTVVIISATLIYHIEPYPPNAPALAEAIKQLVDGTAPSTATWTADPPLLEYKLRAENGWGPYRLGPLTTSRWLSGGALSRSRPPGTATCTR